MNTNDLVKASRELRERFLADRYRPGYHFVVPEDLGVPGDPNGAFYANGRYHLMYLYNRRDVGFCWGHVSSRDLVHWRHHPDAIGPGDGDEGCFSGGAFVDDDGTVYLSYWRLWEDKGIGIARSSDRHYDHWEKLPQPAIDATKFGILVTTDAQGKELILACADPSNIWKKDGVYYMQAGNLPVLNEYGRDPDAPHHQQMRGDWVDLFKSTDLQNWEYVRRFYGRDQSDKWTDASEDDMCPSFLPLPGGPNGGEPSGKHLQLFISHNKGCQYYIGEYRMDQDEFIPEVHGRMTWADNLYFAPEALIDGQGRQIMWAWLLGNRQDSDGEQENGWSGVYGLPRVLWLGADGTLRMAPPPELEQLRGNEQQLHDLTVDAEDSPQFSELNGESCELKLTVEVQTARQVGLKVLASPNGEEEVLVYCDVEAGALVVDSTRCGTEGERLKECAPFELQPAENLHLRVFVDKSVVEVFANDRQAICRRVFPLGEESVGVKLFAADGKATFANLHAWEMMPSNPC